MSIKYIEITADASSTATVSALAEKVKALDFRTGPEGPDGKVQMRLLVRDDRVQQVLDALQNLLGAQPTANIVVMSVEACLPNPGDTENSSRRSVSEARELLYVDVAKGARLDTNYYLLVVLSTLVAAIGLIENNVAVVIGAMVIAPLLGPNLALSFGSAIGDLTLMGKAARTLTVGISLAFILSLLAGMVWPDPLDSHELMSRTDASLDSVSLALASGAAAALSITTGLSGVLVGVMVAVALLPPTVTIGLMLGSGQSDLAMGALLLLAVNIASVNLACNLVFYAKGISPRNYLDKEKARRIMLGYGFGWLCVLCILILLISVS